MRNFALIAVLLILLTSTLSVAFYLWTSLEEVEMGFHGYLALALGAVVTTLVGVGLMALVFYSSRRGHDDDAHRPPDGQ